MRVMIADDDEDMRELLRMVLVSASYTVVGAATDGDEALDMWRRERERGVCAVILDQRMPGKYGVEVAKAILHDDPHQTVVLLSAFIDAETEHEAIAAGIIACIPKQDVLAMPAHPALRHACTDCN